MWNHCTQCQPLLTLMLLHALCSQPKPPQPSKGSMWTSSQARRVYSWRFAKYVNAWWLKWNLTRRTKCREPQQLAQVLVLLLSQHPWQRLLWRTSWLLGATVKWRILVPWRHSLLGIIWWAALQWAPWWFPVAESAAWLPWHHHNKHRAQLPASDLWLYLRLEIEISWMFGDRRTDNWWHKFAYSMVAILQKLSLKKWVFFLRLSWSVASGCDLFSLFF